MIIPSTINIKLMLNVMILTLFLNTWIINNIILDDNTPNTNEYILLLYFLNRYSTIFISSSINIIVLIENVIINLILVIFPME